MLSYHLNLAPFFLEWLCLSQTANGLYFSSLWEASTDYKSLSFDKPLFPQFYETLHKSHFQNGTSCFDCRSYQERVIYMELIYMFLSLCLFPCDIYELWLAGGHPSARTCECFVDGRMIYSDPRSHTVEWLNRCWQTSSGLLRLLVGYELDVREEAERKESCMCLSFKLRSSYSRSILLQGSTQLLIPRLCEEVMRILKGCVSHTSSPLGAHESVRQPSCCKASAV